MDTLTAIRTYGTRADDGRTDFNDLPRGHFSAAKRGGMTRIVEGADDLVSPHAGRGNGGGTSRPTPVLPTITTDHNGDRCNNPRCCPTDGPVDVRSDAQIRFMGSLLVQLEALDAKLAGDALAYMERMTTNGRWTRNQGQTQGTISIWIDRMKAKIAELKAAAPIATPAPAAPVVTPALPVKLDKNGKAMALYYAVDIDGTTKFYRIKPGRKAGFMFIDVQASDEFHQIRFPNVKAAIVSAIVAAGPDDCMARYGQLIGRCGRCGRTLTDADSRARGIGPDCAGKM